MLKRQTARICRVEPWWSVVLGVSTTPSAPSERCTSQPVMHVEPRISRSNLESRKLSENGFEQLLTLGMGGKREGLLRRPSRCPRQWPAKPKTAPMQAQECAEEAKPQGIQDDSRRASRWRGTRARAARQRRGSRCQMIFLMRGARDIRSGVLVARIVNIIEEKSD